MACLIVLYATLYQLVYLLVHDTCHSLRERHVLTVERGKPSHRRTLVHQEDECRWVLSVHSCCIGCLALQLQRVAWDRYSEVAYVGDILQRYEVLHQYLCLEEGLLVDVKVEVF